MNFTKSVVLSLLVGSASLSIGLPVSALAITATSEQDYENQMNQTVRPFFAMGTEGSFQGVGGVSIDYRYWENTNEIGAIVIFPGRADPYISYAETIYDLSQQGYSVYALDHRGQGYSGRMLPDPEKGYVEHFENYVLDAKTFVDTVVSAKPHIALFLVAHSMGGGIAGEYIKQYPNDFNAVSLVTPMFGINTSPFPTFIANALTGFLSIFDSGEDYALTQGPYDPKEQFSDNILTTSQERWDNVHSLKISDPKLALGGATDHWLDEANDADHDLHDNAANISTPILLFSSGNDKLVLLSDEQYMCQHVQKCTPVPTYATAMHALLQEQDAVRNDVVGKTLEFFAGFLKPIAPPDPNSTEQTLPDPAAPGPDSN